MRKVVTILLTMFMVSSVRAGETELPLVIDMLTEAFQLLGDSTIDPCSICAERSREKAYQILDREFRPGRILKSNDMCQFMRSEEYDGKNELALTCYRVGMTAEKRPQQGETLYPLLTLRFHTSTKHLVGIAKTDFTQDRIASEYDSSPSGAIFSGAVKITKYRYGDGPAYNYFPTRNHLQVHCQILALQGTKGE